MAKDKDGMVGLAVRLASIEEDVKELTETVKHQTAALERYKGIIGGVMLVFSLGAAAFTLFINYIKAKT